MNRYYNKINFPFYPLESSYNIFEQINPIQIINLKFLNPELKEFFEDLKVYVSLIECFYRKPFNVGSIHIDSTGGDLVKLNYIYYGKGSNMEWFEPFPNASPISKLTSANTPYIEYNQEDVCLVESQVLNGSYLVQVGIPHRVKNYREPRYCVSLILNDASYNRLTMEQAQESFKNYFI